MNIGFRIIKDFDRPDLKLIEETKKYNSSVIADNMNRNFCLDPKIKKINDKQIKMTGTAFTIKTEPGDNLLVHKALELAKPGDILVINAEGYTKRAILGELMVEDAKAAKLAGVIVDGAIRDSDEIKKSTFPVFAKSFSPQGPFKEGPGEINVSISCGGVVINPGDIIMGDGDGIVVIPPNYADEILKKAGEKLAREEKTKDNIIENGLRDKSWTDKILKEKGCKIIDYL